MTSATGTNLFTDNTRFADLHEWRREAVQLHDAGPIHRIEADQYRPFWAVIGHDAVRDVERHAELFTNEPYPVLLNNEMLALQDNNMGIRPLVAMDDPEHRRYRGLTSDWFKPRRIGRLSAHVDELCRDALARMEQMDGSCDFATEIAIPMPLQVVLEILGLPIDDYPRMLKLTQELFGNEDPAVAREGALEHDSTVAETIVDLLEYFRNVTHDRRANPTEDLSSVIANAKLDGEHLSELELMGYYVIVATAGHDTTSNAMAGGLEALISHPDQLETLQEDMDLLHNAIEEMLRWTAPVHHFMRTAQADCEIAGRPIAEGDWIYLSYLAANLDPAVFGDPLTFDVTRDNADHQLSFGYGKHFCLGAHLARLELRALFTHLVPRIEWIDFAGDPVMTESTFVGGYRSLPISCELRS